MKLLVHVSKDINNDDDSHNSHNDNNDSTVYLLTITRSKTGCTVSRGLISASWGQTQEGTLNNKYTIINAIGAADARDAV